METTTAASSPRAALPAGGVSRKRRRRQSPPPLGEGPGEHLSSRPRFEENLDLILSLQGKELSLERKIEMVFNFLTTGTKQQSHGHRADSIQLSRMVSFIGNWVQFILTLPDNSKKVSESFDPVLDFRCWTILRFCLEKKPSISVSVNLLKPLGRVARDGLNRVDTGASCGDNESFELFERVLDSILFLFSSNTRAFFNAGVDLWNSCAVEAISLVQKVSPKEKNVTVLQNFGNCLLEQFSSFLRFYANPKNIFRAFIDKILDPLLELLVLLNSQTNFMKHKHIGTTLKIVEEILSNGLFHPQHLSGYFGINFLNKVSIAKDVKVSYHRHLFERFKGVKAESKSVLLAGFGYLLRLFVSRARNQRTSLAPRGTIFKSLQITSEGSEETQHHRESLFEVFMQFMEPLVLECKSYLQKDFSDLEVTKLVEVHCMLKSFNEMLRTVAEEKIYVPTEDTPEGSYLQFLQDTYRVLILICEKMYEFWVSTVHLEDMDIKKMLPLMFVEIVVALGHFVEIEYKVMGGDLVKLWSIIFALSAINGSSKDIKPCFLLASKICNLTSQVIFTFSELRQVSHSIFMLCNAVRTFGSVAGPYVVPGLFSVDSLSSDKCLESLATLLSSQTLRGAICTSVSSMPEGQSSKCIEELIVDLTDTLKWMKSCTDDVDLESKEGPLLIARKLIFDLKAELFGRHLSELYAGVLDSITVTTSNSTLVAKSVERLVNAIQPSLSQLVRNELINSSEFIFSVVGKNLSKKKCANWQKIPSLSWLFVFFFRIYISCRSLYRQSVILMPPDLAIQATELVGNSFILCCGKEWVNTANITAEGYFVWIAESSGSLLDVIEILSQSIPRNSGFTVMVYMLHVMALQRLNDLNRQINAFGFLLEDDTHQFDKEDRENTELLKESCCLEAARLTNFMMNYVRILSSGVNGQFLCYENSCSWDLSICSLDEGSFPLATWRLLCDNIDIWSSHASKKDFKNFFSNVMQFSFVQKISSKDEENSLSQYSYEKITLHTISMELLCDTIIYDQKVLLKNLTSGFCYALKKLVSSFATKAIEYNALLDVSPDLREILNNLDSEKLVGTYPPSHAYAEDQYQICENLLNFLGTVPGFHSNSKSFLRLLSYILHLERLLLLALLNRHFESCSPMELICLFVCCRRAMKNLILKFGKEHPESKQYSAFSKLFGNSYSLIWLLRSVQEIVGLSRSIFGDHTDQMKNTLFSLVDETSEIFSTLANMNSIFCLLSPKKQIGFSLKQSPTESNTLKLDGQSFDTLESSALEYVKTLAEQLEKTTTGIPVTVKGCKCVIKLENCYNTVCWDKLLCTMSCIGGFLRGLISALENTFKDYPISIPEERKLMLQYASSFSRFVAKFEIFVDICLYVLFMDSKDWPVDLVSAHLPQELDCENGLLIIDALIDGWTTHQANDNELQSDCPPSIPSESHCFDLSNIRCMKKSLLENLLNGEDPFVTFTLRELYNVSAAILKLKGFLYFPNVICRQTCSPSQQLSVGLMVGTAYIALQKIAGMSNWPELFSLVWVDGILRYLEVLGTFPQLNLSKELYGQIVNAHVRAIGKCILLEGKSATLPTHEIGSSTKTIHLQHASGYIVNKNVIDRQNKLSALKSRLRLSVRKFVTVASNIHLNATLQVIERALVGVNQYSHSIYEVNTGTSDGGTVSSDVAAGIDCIYLVLESVPGTKRVFKRTVPGLVAALFNIVLHLQSPLIFYIEKMPPLHPNFHPDAGAIVLMCVEVITAFVGRHTFQIDACHVSQCLHLPVTLFKGFKHLLASRSVLWSSESYRDQNAGQPVHSNGYTHEYILDTQFSVDMYAACCKLLCTALRHQQREVGRCVAVLEDSVNILLSCLESSDSKMVSMADYFTWNKEETIKCASFFRRIYEEMRQQKEILGKHSMHFLAGYISMFSGQGPFQTGITSEIDEALRPGVYSLIDICEETDFQQLHTYLGEGPCRTTLANLVHDYKLHFQYQGKI